MSIEHTIGWKIASAIVGLSYQQKVDIAKAYNNADRVARERLQHELDILNGHNEEERRQLMNRLDQLNSQYQDTIREHQNRLSELREEYDRKLNDAIWENEQQRERDRRRFQAELDDAISSVNANIEDLREDTKEAIDRVYDNMDDLWENTQEAINIVNDNINNLRAETEQALAEQQEQINDIVEEVHNDKVRAAKIKDALYEAFQEQLDIVKSKNHQKYAPRQLDAIEARLGGINALPDDAACAILNTQFNDLLTLDANIEQAKMEYEAKHLITLKAAEDVLARMYENRNTISLTDVNGRPIINSKGQIAKIELDFWTEGEYGNLEKELEQIKETVKAGLNDPQYTIKDLDNALNRIMSINQRQNQLVIDCIEKGNASQIRAELSDVIIEHLEGQFFTVDDRGYEKKDARNAYIIKLHNDSSNILVVINPESNTENRVVIGTVNTDLAEPDLIQQGNDINQVLADIQNVVTDGGVCHRRNPEVEAALRSMYDMDIIEKGIPKETRERARLKNIRK